MLSYQLSDIQMLDIIVKRKSKSKSKVKSKVKSKSQVQSQDLRGLRTWDLDFAYCIITTPPPPTTLNFSVSSRGPTTKCYTFLETSHNP